eukprot:Gb_27460 [translate_table: standard]
MAQQLRSWKKMMELIVGSERRLQGRKGTIMTAATIAQREPNACTSLEDVRTLCNQGRLKEALHILHFMNQSIDCSIYAYLLHGCIKKKALSEGKLVHAHMNDTGLVLDRFLWNTLVNMYAKCGSLVDARWVFDQMPERNVFSWTVMIAAYARHGPAEEALSLFYEMQKTGIQPNQFVFPSVLSACAELADLEQGMKINEEIIRTGYHNDVFVGNALVDMYAKTGRIEIARDVFDKMPKRDMVSWTAMVSGYAQNGHVDEALNLFQKMPQRDVFSSTAMISAFAQNGHVDEALKLFQKMPERHVVSWNAMIAGYAQNGHVDQALKLFQEMPERNVVSWNAMITGYTQNGHCEKALKLFGEMQVAGLKPNSKTFIGVLAACANLAALEQGVEIHEEIVKTGFQSDIFVMNALLDMYAKCGSIEKAHNLFDKIPKRNVVVWTTMIAGYAMHGCGKEALKLFEQMQLSGMKPNCVTFVCVLSACCHAGLVDKGWEYFECMRQYYNITPAMEHYGCMVDLLGRAGCLDEAQEFINKMPIKPDATVWRCLLGACRIHNNIELGERVAECLFELDPENPAPYVLLSNIYATSDRRHDIEKVRKMMKDRGIKKTPGCSWIEVNKQVHAFLVGDRSHPQAQEIYAKLESLLRQMRAAGYVPDTRFMLNDMEEQ